MQSYEGCHRPSTMAFVLWPVCTWTFKGILCTCRFLWICPYNAIQFMPREKPRIKDISRLTRPNKDCECKVPDNTPGSPDRTADLRNRVTKTEKEILSLKTRIACERASWERRFAELQRKQEQLVTQLTSERAGSDSLGESGVDNGEVFEESTSEGTETIPLHRGYEVLSKDGTYTNSHYSCITAQLSSRPSSSLSSVTSVQSWRSSTGPHRVFVPHSPLDLQLGHRVRILLPSGRISTGAVRFIGHLQGEEELHLGIELHSPDHGVRDGSYRGHCYFECKPGYGAFVPFHKLLMAWE